ncbi:HSP90 family molecular chaperone [Psychrobacter sp. PL15]|nr:HSP90 family molecular chaperone [Psychrobacter sp. PL15]
MKKLSKKQTQWAWFIGLYLVGFLTIFIIAQLIKLAMGV